MVARNRFELEQWGKLAGEAYLERKVPLNTSITKIASRENLTPDQVQRIVESANAYTNGVLVKTAKLKGEDPRISFDLASAKEVAAGLPDTAKTASDLERRAALEHMFTPPERDGEMVKVASADALDAAFPLEKVANPNAGKRGAVPDDLSRSFLFNRQAAIAVAKLANAGQISAAITDLESLEHRAKLDAATLRNEMDVGFSKMASIVEGELFNKTHPLHIKEWAKQAGVPDDIQEVLSKIVDDRVEILQLSFPKEASPLPGVYLTNTDHPLKAVSDEVVKIANEHTDQQALIEKVKAAVADARACLREAVTEETRDA